jgi:4-phospho-D-threonate 3-dehydrogenase / 4-phospho-D-erythronate 3-dehydrogenase
MTGSRPIIGISMGDPAGIGPEIIVRALMREEVRRLCRPLVIGDAGVMRRAVGVVDGRWGVGDRRREDSKVEQRGSLTRGETGGEVAPMEIRPVRDVQSARYEPGTIDVLDLGNVDVDRLEMGRVSSMAGHAAFEAIRKMIEMAMAGEIAATVTAPIHKEALAAAGQDFPGHTEIFGHFTGTKDFTMMLAAGDLRVVHVSTHVSLRRACDAVKRDRVLKVIGLAHEACRKLGIDRPRIGVAGLNPHASDGGLFGSEEKEEIIPAVEAAREKGMVVEGPQPPDTFFAKAISGYYDCCVAMYHDQGHIPVKIAGFRFDAKAGTWASVKGINISLGLPIIRTSVDHGTAFDQAGKGTASDASMVEAIEYAVRMVRGSAG